MERYAYLTLSLSFAIVLAILLLARRDVIKLALRTGVFGGIAGVISEAFYFRDYWRPPSLFGIATISPEDFIFGFSITATAVIAYMVLCRKRLAATEAPRQGKVFLSFFVLGLLSVIIFSLWLGVNSILVSSTAFLVLAAIMLIIRRDLAIAAVYSAMSVTLLMLAVYIVLFDFVFTHFWQQYWLLYGTSYGLMLFGHVPLTELLWYFAWAFVGSISYPFITGRKFASR